MKNTSRIMYRIGKIFNIVVIVALAIWFVVAFILMFVAIASPVEGTEKAVAIGSAIGSWVWAGILLACAVVALILANKAIDAVGNGQVDRKPHIICIVMGAISENPFYVLGGIFGLIAESQEG